MNQFNLEYQSTRAERFGPMSRAADDYMERATKILDSFGGGWIGPDGPEYMADNGYTIRAVDLAAAEKIAKGLSDVVGHPVTVTPRYVAGKMTWREFAMFVWSDGQMRWRAVFLIGWTLACLVVLIAVFIKVNR